MELRFHFKNLAKHGVTSEEVEECFADPQRLTRKIGGIYWLIAKTDAGRFLQIGYRKEGKAIYLVFHAMLARNFEQRQYKARGK